LPTSLAPRLDQRQFISCAPFPGLALSQLLARVYLRLLDIAFYRLTEIGNQVVAIRNLNGGGSALSSSIGIQAGPIAGDHYHLRMQTEQARKTPIFACSFLESTYSRRMQSRRSRESFWMSSSSTQGRQLWRLTCGS
jgi:hypothetical protein